jgi:hypothetical protein
MSFNYDFITRKIQGYWNKAAGISDYIFTSYVFPLTIYLKVVEPG